MRISSATDKSCVVVEQLGLLCCWFEIFHFMPFICQLVPLPRGCPWINSMNLVGNCALCKGGEQSLVASLGFCPKRRNGKLREIS